MFSLSLFVLIASINFETLELLNSFRQRLFNAKEKQVDNTKEGAEEGESGSESLWTHRLELSEEIKQKVIDANVADNDRWDIYDPRNPLNKRKREESKDIMSEKKRSGTSSSYRSRNNR